jgi:hypothetical protein
MNQSLYVGDFTEIGMSRNQAESIGIIKFCFATEKEHIEHQLKPDEAGICREYADGAKEWTAINTIGD